MSTKDDPLKALTDLVHEYVPSHSLTRAVGALAEVGTEAARARQSESAWRSRIEQAAEALADVLPGEAGRLDLLARISELKRQRDAAVADLAAILNAWSTGEHGVAVVLEGLCSAKPVHPGAVLLEEVQTLRQRQALWEEVADTLYGYAVFVGPCVHGRDPWDRCDECGEESAVHALVKVNNALLEQHRKALARARNEGLEKAATKLESIRSDPLITTGTLLADDIRAMKEPEQ